MRTIHVVSSANMAAENEGLDAVKEWLTSEVKLKQYFDKLVLHGFTTLEACSIIDENALNRLEIIPPYHRKRLMKFSVNLREKLRNRSDEEDNTNHDLARGNGKQNELISFGDENEKTSSPPSIPTTAVRRDEAPVLPPKKIRPPPIPRRLDLDAEDAKTQSIPVPSREAPPSDPGPRRAAPVKPPRTSRKLSQENVLLSHSRTDLGGKIAGHCSNGRDGDIGSAVVGESVLASSTESQIATCVNDIGTEQHRQQTLNEPIRKASEEEPECRSPTGNNVQGKESQSEMSTIQPTRPVPTPPVRLSSSMSSSSFKKPVPAPRSRFKSEQGLDLSNLQSHSNSNEVTPAIPPKRPMSFSKGQVRQPAIPNEKPSTLPRYPQYEKPPPPLPPTRQTPVTPLVRQPVENSAPRSSLMAPPATVSVSPTDETSNAPVSQVPGQTQNPLGTPDSQEYEEISPRQRSQPVTYDLLNPAVQDPRNSVANAAIYESVGSKPNNGGQETAEVEYESDDCLSEGADDLWMYDSVKMRSDSIDSTGGSDNSRGSGAFLYPNVRQSDGYLWKQGGQQGNKGWRKRWFVFNGKDLRYFKDKDSLNESLHIIPVTQIRDIENVKDAKRSCFKVITPNRTFLLAAQNITEMILWSQTLMEACRGNRTDSISGKRGGDMNEPDKEGWLKKQGHNVVADWKKRYVAIKEDKICYYDTYEDFYYATPINCINAALAKVKISDGHRNRFLIITPNKSYSFQAETESEAASWMVAIETAIQIGLGDRMILEKVYENPSNRYCADCGMKDPVWASVNFCVCVCAHCIGVHRNLGVHCSKPRSLLMDEKVWNPTLLELMVKIGNANANQLLEHKLPDDDKILPDTESSLRREFIYSKYWEKKYCKFHRSFGNPNELGEVLQKTVVTEDVMTTLELIINKVDVHYISSDSEDEKPPIELAREAGQTLQAELLRQNGAESGKLDRQISFEDLCGTVNNEVAPVSPAEVVYEKEGFLYKKEGSWRKRWFLLKERELKYTRGPHEKEELGMINLRTVTSLVKVPKMEPLQLDVVTVDKTHSLKADTDEELEAWYSALKSKQVFGVLLSQQELGSDGIPHLVAKCLQFVESYGGIEMEGVYRVNGSQLMMKKLETSFDQDAARVLLTLDECGVHDVTGVLKKYLRHLPDPVIPGDMYDAFIQASLNPDHSIRLQTIKELIASLPKVNHDTLKKIVFHLTKVVSCVAVNKMGIPNVAMIFGPTLMSNEQTGGMDDSSINKEFLLTGEMITYFQWLFDVNEEEVRKDQIMKDALEKIRRLQTESTQPQPSSEEFTLDIYVNEANEQPCRLKVSGDMTAHMVCSQIVSQRALAPDVNWALFEVVGNGAMERAFQVREKVLAAAKWGSGNYLILKENYIAENIAPYVGSTLSIEGPLHTRDPKNKNWKQSSVCLKNGYMLVDKGKSFFKAIKSDKSETDQWPLHKMTLYVGIPAEKSTKGLDPSCGFTVVVKTDQEDITRYMCAKDKGDMHRWVAAVLNMKHPEGIWSDPSQADTVGTLSAESKGKQTEDLPFFLGRQSFNLRRKGSSKHVVEELRLKQKSLRRPVDRAPPPT